MHRAIGIALLVAYAGQAMSAESAPIRPFAALGLDSSKPIKWNLKTLSSVSEYGEVWLGKVGEFYVSMAGEIAAPPTELQVSIDVARPRAYIESALELDGADALAAGCPLDLLMDDGIGCDAMFYGCDGLSRRCSLRMLTYSREESADYPAFPGWVQVNWSSAGFDFPTP